MTYMFVVFTIFFGLLVSPVEAQPDVTFDADIPCWLNVTDDMNISYSLQEQSQIEEYFQINMIDAAANVSENEQSTILLKQSETAQNALYYDLFAPTTLGDIHYIGNIHIRDVTRAYPTQSVGNSTNHYLLAIQSFGTMLHVCVGDQIVPDYRFIIEHIIEKSSENFISGLVPSNLNATIHAQALAVRDIWADIQETGLDHEQVATAAVSGLLKAYKVVGENVAQSEISGIAESIAGEILSLAPTGFNETAVLGLVLDVALDLGIEIDVEDVEQVVTGLVSDVLANIGGK